MRGFSSIGLVRPKSPWNIGGVLRLAQNYDVAMIAIAGDRSQARDGVSHGTNTMRSEKHVPLIRGDDLHDLIPFGAVPVAVDLVDGAIPLPSYQHPASAFYVFGPENGTLGHDTLSWCRDRVMVPTRCCMNLHVTVGVILYDRLAKSNRTERKARLVA